MTYSIPLHKEFGLNPTISKCIICGKGKNQIALLGSKYKGQAPMYMVTEPEPCETCQKKYLSKGVLLIEANKDEKGKIIPTGRLAVMKDEAYNKIFNVPAPKKIVYVEPEAYEKIGLHKIHKKPR